MLRTYKALLRGNNLEWSGDVPEHLGKEQAIEVYVTILEENSALVNGIGRGEKMAEALEGLASADIPSTVRDPVEWQRESRRDRSLPGRDE